MKHQVIALMIHDGEVGVGQDENVYMELPQGCTGMCFVFESKKAARDFWGKDVKLRRVVLKNQK